MTSELAVDSAAARWIRRTFPRRWRHDGRAADMVTTALEKAEAEGRSELGPLEVADLAVFGLRMRAEPWWRSAPRSARTITGWAGVLGGLTLAATATIRPWVIVQDPADPTGLLPWPALVLALWCLLAFAVIVGSAWAVRAAAAAVMVVLPASLLSSAPTLTPMTATGASGASHQPMLLFNPDLAWSTTFYLGLPIWLCACLALGATPVVRTVAPARAALVAAAVTTAAALVLLPAPMPLSGIVWSGAPYYLGTFAVAVIVLAAVMLGVLFAVRPRSAPAAMIAAGPWLIVASVKLTGPGHLAVGVWIAAWLALTATSVITWRRGTAGAPQPT